MEFKLYCNGKKGFCEDETCSGCPHYDGTGSREFHVIKKKAKMFVHVHVEGSYRVWNPVIIRCLIDEKITPFSAAWYTPYIIEWWLHNIGYYLTKSNRCKHVDLMVRVL